MKHIHEINHIAHYPEHEIFQYCKIKQLIRASMNYLYFKTHHYFIFFFLTTKF